MLLNPNIEHGTKIPHNLNRPNVPVIKISKQRRIHGFSGYMHLSNKISNENDTLDHRD